VLRCADDVSHYRGKTATTLRFVDDSFCHVINYVTSCFRFLAKIRTEVLKMGRNYEISREKCCGGFVVDVLNNKLYNKSTTSLHVEMLLICRTTNPQQIVQVEFGLTSTGHTGLIATCFNWVMRQHFSQDIS